MQQKMEFVGRVLIAQVFIIAGLSKIPNYADTWSFMVSTGVPGGLLPMVILLEVIGGLALLCGIQTRFIAVVLAMFSLITAFVFHNNFADQLQLMMFIKNIAISGGLIMLAASAANAFSVDARSSAYKKSVSNTEDVSVS